MFNIFFNENNKKGGIMEFNESKTKQNLARLFAIFCQDSARYNFVATNAEKEGFYYLKELLLSLSAQKMAHAKIIYKLMLENSKKRKDKVNIESGYPFEKQLLSSTLFDCYQIEEYEGGNLLPHFEKLAQDENFKEIALKLQKLSQVIQTNTNMLKKLSEAFDNHSLYKFDKKMDFICSNCGFSDNLKEGWINCPLCGYSKGHIKFNFFDR